ncbi:MAG: hypothetical protein E7603_02960 [Ruminococcaceae bacterium]|nr:hypothetical protein [Oscillospiraceae bacterium]
MIAFFPQIYPDELLYSQIARYHAHGGYSNLVFTMTDIYKNANLTLPSVEFVNQYTEDAMKWITKNKLWESVVEQHTMYPAYIRFLPKSRRGEAVSGIIGCNGNWKKLMCLPVLNEKKYLRYCPECAHEDREKHGETYWHRAHQIPRIRICPRHQCFLECSDIPISSKTAPGLFDAESNIPKNSIPRKCNSDREIGFTQYVLDVMREPIDTQNDLAIGKYLHSRLPSDYVNESGLVRNIEKLYHDYLLFFGDNMPTMTQSYMQKIFNGYAYDNYFILQMAYFLKISVQEITHLPNDIPSTNLREIYQQLSAKHRIDISIVEEIASAVLKYSNQQNIAVRKSGPRAIQYDKLDEQYLPQVKTIVEQMLSNEGKPQKLSFAKVQKALNLPQKQINKLPQCKAYIEQNLESQEAFWAREVEWAVSVMDQENHQISRSRIMKMTNMRPNDIECCCPHIKNKETQTLVQSLLNE